MCTETKDKDTEGAAWASFQKPRVHTVIFLLIHLHVLYSQGCRATMGLGIPWEVEVTG